MREKKKKGYNARKPWEALEIKPLTIDIVWVAGKVTSVQKPLITTREQYLPLVAKKVYT